MRAGVATGLEMAKVLAFSAAALRAGVERVEKAELELTAVIEPAARLGATDEEPERLEMYRFGVETMEEHQIRVLTTSDMGRVAETARRELRCVKDSAQFAVVSDQASGNGERRVTGTSIVTVMY